MNPRVTNHAVDRYLGRVLKVNATWEDVPSDHLCAIKGVVSELARLPFRYPQSWRDWKKHTCAFTYVVGEGAVITILEGSRV